MAPAIALMRALEMLAVGIQATNVAFDLDYGSVSAFTAMFRRSFGIRSTSYFNEKQEPNVAS